MHKTIGVIPARFASTRFPGKPLVGILGKPMIQRVYEQCMKSDLLDEVIVATDHPDIYNTVEAFGGKAAMTNPNHPSGTDRCLEAIQNVNLDLNENDVIINIQGDEPFIDPEQISLLADLFSNEDILLGTLIKRITDISVFENPNSPKVVTDIHGKALYFSRSAIPFHRDTIPETANHLFQHVGIYGYRLKTLEDICRLKPSFLEETEGLEQLRWIENGYNIYTAISHHESLAVDTPEDLKKIEIWHSKN
ncbi:MAG: 3-deoxy-manno-octulosonate cytidylyltransferase (CMP-KDO synthetase) [Candidatus Azotimanducaceae bacterium]|jgi:3-deoxy-manno-octulosonate cytidylyltransferase (CMP-KDO synthetase)